MSTPPIRTSSNWGGEDLSRQTEESSAVAQTAEADQAHPVGEAPIGHPEGEQNSSPFVGLPLELHEKIVDNLASRDVHNLSMTSQAFAAATSRRRKLELTAHNVLKNYGIAHLAGKGTQEAISSFESFVETCKPEELKAVVDARKLNLEGISSKGSLIFTVVTSLCDDGMKGLETNKEDKFKKISILLKAGADPDAANTGAKAMSCLEYALQNKASSFRPELIPMLLKAGADPNGLNIGSGSILEIATSIGDKDAVRQLIDAGADPEYGWKQHSVPLATVEREIENTTDPVKRSNYREIRGMLHEAVINRRESGVNPALSVRAVLKPGDLTKGFSAQDLTNMINHWYTISVTEQDVQAVLDLYTESKKS